MEIEVTKNKICHFEVSSSMGFSIFKELFSDHLNQYQNIFITLKGNSLLIKQSFSTSYPHLSLW